MGKVTGTLTGPYKFEWQEKNQQGQWITKTETLNAILSFTISNLKFDSKKTVNSVTAAFPFSGNLNAISNKLKWVSIVNLKPDNCTYELNSIADNGFNIFGAFKKRNTENEYEFLKNEFIIVDEILKGDTKTITNKNRYIYIDGGQIDSQNKTITLQITYKLNNIYPLSGTLTGDYEEVNSTEEPELLQQEPKVQQGPETQIESPPVNDPEPTDTSSPENGNSKKGPIKYQEKIVENSKKIKSTMSLNKLAKDKNYNYDVLGDSNTTITDSEIQECVGDMDITNISNTNEYTNDTQLDSNITQNIVSNNIENNNNLLNNITKTSDPFVDSPKGLGTFGDLEKLLSFTGGINNIINLLSKFFNLDLSVIENINDIGGSISSGVSVINQLVPGSTSNLLDSKVPKNSFKSSATPDIIEANPNIPGAIKLNNTAKQIKNEIIQNDLDLQKYGNTKEVEVTPPEKIELEKYKEIETDKMGIGGLEKLLSIEEQTTEGAQNPFMASKIEGIQTISENSPFTNNGIQLLNISATLNLKLNGTNLDGNATVTFNARNNADTVLYTGKSEGSLGSWIIKLQNNGKVSSTSTFKVNRSATEIKGKPYYIFYIDANNSSYDANNKTIKLNIYPSELNSSYAFEVKGNYV